MAVFLITIMLICSALGNNIKIVNNSFSQCSLYFDNFWQVMKHHFLLVKSLTVQVLKTDKHQHDLDQYTLSLLKQLNSAKSLTALKIQEKYLKLQNHSPKYSFSNNSFSNISQKFSKISYKKLYHLKRLSSDSSEGYFLIIWDVDSLHNFLNENFQARATYAIQFIFTSSEKSCETIRHQTSHILKRFWTDYNVFNLIAQTSCWCDSEQVYIYRPFVKIDNFWGITNIYKLEDVIKNYQIITNPLINLNRFPLNIGIFPKTPTAIKILPKLLSEISIYKNLKLSKGYGGVDGLILSSLAECLNFDITVVGEETANNYGKILLNGSATGAIGDVIARRTVYSANSRFLVPYNTNKLEFTRPCTTEKICLAVPKSSKVYKWSTIFRCFNALTWLCLMCTFPLCTIFWYYFKLKINLEKAFCTISKFLLGVSVNINPTLAQMCFLTSCMGFSIVISSIIQGFLFQSFTSTTFYPDIDTIKEFDESGLAFGSSIFTFIRNDNSNTIKNLESKTFSPPPNVFDLVAYHRNIATSDTKSFLELIIKTQYLDEDGWPLIHIVDECFETFLITAIVPKGSAFLTVFNNVITKLIESGLTRKWMDDVINSMIIENWIRLNRNKSKTRAFTLYDLQVAFYVIILGYVGSILVFISEILHKKCFSTCNRLQVN